MKIFEIPDFKVFLMIMMGLTGWNHSAWAETREHPVLTGETWEQMSSENKAAFVWGMATVLEYERQVQAVEQLDDGQGFVPLMIEGLSKSGIGAIEIVTEVDEYYEVNPHLRHRPVLHAVFHEVIIPVLNTNNSKSESETNQRGKTP